MAFKVNAPCRIATDPVFRQAGDKGGFINFRVASDRSFAKKMDDGSYKNEPDFFDVDHWVKSGSGLIDILEKGMMVYISGEMQISSWENSDGEKRSKPVIKTDGVGGLVLGDKSKKSSSSAPSGDGDDDDIPSRNNRGVGSHLPAPRFLP